MISKGFFYKFAAYLLIVLAFSNFSLANKIIHVDNNGTADFNNIQAAIDDANNGDTVLVADGTYTGDGNRDIDFKGKAITVKSQNGPETCIIDCQRQYGNYRGFYFHNDEDANSILQDFTITNGYSENGGAVYCQGSSPKIKNCIITENKAREGGGIAMTNSYSQIINCTISKNVADNAGGIYINKNDDDKEVLVQGCIITGNQALVHPKFGGIGGGIIVSSFSNIINCTIAGNWGSYGSGGIEFDYGANVSNCIISDNFSGFGNFYNVNQIVVGNYFRSDPRDPVVYYPKVSINNSLIGNGNVKDIIHISGNEDYLIGNWSYGNPFFASTGYWDPNIFTFPVNAVWVEGDYHLKSQAGRFDPNSQSWVQDDVTSPCIDAGDPNSPIGYEPFPNGGYINMGAYGGTAEASTSYFGKPVCETIVAGDINGDCKVDIFDFEIMLLHWLEDNNP